MTEQRKLKHIFVPRVYLNPFLKDWNEVLATHNVAPLCYLQESADVGVIVMVTRNDAELNAWLAVCCRLPPEPIEVTHANHVWISDSLTHAGIFLEEDAVICTRIASAITACSKTHKVVRLVWDRDKTCLDVSRHVGEYEGLYYYLAQSDSKLSRFLGKSEPVWKLIPGTDQQRERGFNYLLYTRDPELAKKDAYEPVQESGNGKIFFKTIRHSEVRWEPPVGNGAVKGMNMNE